MCFFNSPQMTCYNSYIDKFTILPNYILLKISKRLSLPICLSYHPVR